MLWVIAAVGAFLIYFLFFFRTTLRRSIALNLAAQRACASKDFAGAVRLCRESYDVAARLKDPQKSRIQAQIEIQWATLLYRQGRIGEAEDLFRQGFSHAKA